MLIVRRLYLYRSLPFSILILFLFLDIFEVHVTLTKFEIESQDMEMIDDTEMEIVISR